MSRQLSVAVMSLAEPGAPVGLPCLVRTLSAVQKLALQVGEMLADTGSQRSRGEFSSAVRRSCELVVRDLRAGSAVAELELPPAEPSLFPEMTDLGPRALDTILRLTHEVTNGAAWAEVCALLPDEAHRRLILTTYKHLCPTASEGVVVSVADPESDLPPSRLSADTRTRVQVLATQVSNEDVLEERRLIGRLVMLRSREPTFEIRQESRSLRCPYDPDLAEQLLGLFDAMVSVRGVCRVVKHDDRDDDILELLDVGEVTYLDEGELTATQIATEGAPLLLAAPLSVTPEFSDNLVVFEYRPLGIIACGETREEAATAFGDELAWLWAEYGQRPDEALSRDTRELKAHLLGLLAGGAQ